MAEFIELKQISRKGKKPQRSKSKDDDVVQYNEQKSREPDETTPPSAVRSRLVEEYNFFASSDVVGEGKHKDVMKKQKRRASKTAADIINLELANMENPITENVISMITYNDQDYFVDPPKSNRETDMHIKMFAKMKERIRREDSSDWLDENGEPLFYLTQLRPKRRSQNLPTSNIHVDYVKPIIESCNSYSNLHRLQTPKISLLDIRFDYLRFKHHHLFSIEHVLSECLKENYKEYLSRNAENILQKIDDDIKISRNAREKVKSELLKLNKSKEDIYLDSTVTKYNKRIAELKDQYRTERAKDDEILTKMLLLWSDIKYIRQGTGITNTSLLIEIYKEDIDQDVYTEMWNEKNNAEFTDTLHNIEFEYAKKMVEYKNQKQNNKENIKKTYTKLIKPRLHFDEDEIKEHVEELLKDIVPRRPKVIFKLIFDSGINTEDITNSNEQERRNKMMDEKYFIKVYVDDIVAFESEYFGLNNDFSTELSENYSIQILPCNKNITIGLLENDIMLAKIKIDLSTVKEPIMKQYIFDVKSKIESTGYCCGSGNTLKDLKKYLNIDLQSDEIIKDKFYSKVELRLIMEWNERKNEKDISSFKDYIETSKKMNNLLNSSDINFNLLDEVLIKTCETQEVLDTLLSMQNEIKNVLNDKRFNDASKIIHDQKTTLNNTRLTLLRYRNSGKFNDLRNSIVPLISNQISTEQMQYLTNDYNNDFIFYEDNSTSAMEPIDLQRYLGAKYIQILNMHIFQNINDNMMKKTYDDIVKDTQIWNLRMFGRLAVRRYEEANHKLLNTYHSSSVHDIQITLFRAFCMPDRTSMAQSDTNHDEHEGFKVKQLRPFVRVSYKESNGQTATAVGGNPTWNQTLNLTSRSNVSSVININIYDEVKENLMDTYDPDEQYQSNKAVHYRLNHRWLGSLQIPLRAVQSFSKIQGALKINIPPVILGYQTSTETKSNSNLLHSHYDPILPMQRDTAFITLTISAQPHLPINKCITKLHKSDKEFIFTHLNDFLNDYGKEFPDRIVYLTYIGTSGHEKCVIQFLQALPVPDLELFQRELKAFTRRESAMSKSSSSSQARSSDGKKSGIDAERGDSANTPRSGELWTGERDSTYNIIEVRTVKKEGNQLDRVMHTCARYVSLIPLYESSQGYEVTLMGWELLKTLHGSPLDHTILLSSYFLYLGIKCWIICGMSIPRGFSSYVLVQYDLKTERILLSTDDTSSKSRHFMKPNAQIPFVYDAVAAVKYDLRDPCCPLKTVYYAYNDENIWINLQLSESCESVRLDFTRSSDWLPVFNKNVSLSKLPTVPEVNLYTSPENVESLKQKIENKIKTKATKWRVHRRTIWNRYCSSVLKDSLPNWEFWAFNPSSPKPGPSNRLKQLMSTYRIYGFPLNVPYTNMKAILSSIKTTAIFLNDDPSVEFGLAVDVYSYPNSVMSVWIYLASILRN